MGGELFSLFLCKGKQKVYILQFHYLLCSTFAQAAVAPIQRQAGILESKLGRKASSFHMSNFQHPEDKWLAQVIQL